MASVVSAQQTVDLAAPAAELDRPLDVVLHLQPGDARQLELPLTCLQVEVRYGDFAVPPGQVQVTSVTPPGANHIRLSVFSPLLVNEPLVHLRLAITCEPQLERRWTLFADPPRPTTLMPTAAMPEGRWLDSAAGIAAATQPVDTPLDTVPAARPRPDTRTAAPRAAAEPRSHSGTARPAPARARSAAPNSRPGHPAGAHLSLGPDDTELLAQAVWNLIQRHQASMPPANPQALHGELLQLRLDNEQLRVATTALLARVEAMEGQAGQGPRRPSPRWTLSAAWVGREALPWLAGLATVMLLAWGLHRFNQQRDDSLAGADLDGSSPCPAPASRSQVAAPKPPARTPHDHRAKAVPASRPPAHTTQEPAPSWTALPVVPAALPGPAPEAPCACVEQAMPAGMRAQVEQMVREGDLASALILLEFHLDQQPTKSAPTLLALLDIYQSLGQHVPAQGVRDQLGMLFNVRATAQPDDGTGLEAHPATLGSISSHWSGPHVREVLKNLMLRPTALEELQLSAFREVLSLYELAGLREDQ